MLYVGVDLHRKASQVAVVDEQGKLLFNRHVPSHREDLLRIFGEAGPSESMQVAYEATYGWGWFADLCHHNSCGDDSHARDRKQSADPFIAGKELVNV